MITCQMIISRDQGKAFAEEHAAFRIAEERHDEDRVLPVVPSPSRPRRELLTQLARLLEASIGSAVLPWRLLVGR
jgi:hypothetical protein